MAAFVRFGFRFGVFRKGVVAVVLAETKTVVVGRTENETDTIQTRVNKRSMLAMLNLITLRYLPLDRANGISRLEFGF